MRSDLKIGVIVGALLVVGLIVYFMSRGEEPGPAEPMPVLTDNMSGQGGDTTNPVTGGETGVPAGQEQTPPVEQSQADLAGGGEITPPDQGVVTPPDQGQVAPPEEVTPPETVEAPPVQQVEPPVDVDEERQPRFYTVEEGDSLSGIALSYYAHEKFALVIQMANQDKITDINRLRTGWRLRIPYPDEAAVLWARR